jgi:hypothetical protein
VDALQINLTEGKIRFNIKKSKNNNLLTSKVLIAQSVNYSSNFISLQIAFTNNHNIYNYCACHERRNLNGAHSSALERRGGLVLL